MPGSTTDPVTELTPDSENSPETVVSARIPEELDGTRMDAVLSILFPDRSRSYWQTRIGEGDVVSDGVTVTKTGKKGKSGHSIMVSV